MVTDTFLSENSRYFKGAEIGEFLRLLFVLSPSENIQEVDYKFVKLIQLIS